MKQVDQKMAFLSSSEFLDPFSKLGINFQPNKINSNDDNDMPIPIAAMLNVIKTELIPAIRKFEEFRV